MCSSWTMPAASGSRTAAGSAPLSRMWFRAPPATCSPQRSSGFESRGIPVVFHCHDEVTVEVPIGSLSDAGFLEILLELPDLGDRIAARWQGPFRTALSRTAGSIRAMPLTTPDPDDRATLDERSIATSKTTRRHWDRSTIRPWLNARTTRTLSPTWPTTSRR